MKISIVIPAYNNIDSVRRLLRSIYAQFDESQGKAIVVDDGSKSCDMTVLKGEFADLKVIRLESNAGAANARNLGAEAALYDIIFFLDSDMILCDNVIDEIFSSMKDPAVGAVVGTVRDTHLTKGVFQDYWALLKAYLQFPRVYSSTFYPMIGVIRKNVFKDTGLFDSGIRGASVEEFEFSMRFAAKGYKALYNPKIVAITTYKDFFTSIRQSMERSRKWGILFLDRREFDNHTTTLSQGLSNAFGFAALVNLVAGCFNSIFLIFAAVFLSLSLIANRGFLAYVIKKRGAVFMLISEGIYLISSFFITTAFLSGILYIFAGKKARHEALYD